MRGRRKKKIKCSTIIFILIPSRKTGTFLSPPVIPTRELEHRVHYSILIYQTKGLASIDRLQQSPALLARPRAARSCGPLSKTSNTTRSPPTRRAQAEHSSTVCNTQATQPPSSRQQAAFKNSFFQDLIWFLYKKFEYHVKDGKSFTGTNVQSFLLQSIIDALNDKRGFKN